MRKQLIIRTIKVLIVSLLAISCTVNTDIDARLNDLLSGQSVVIPLGSDSVKLYDILSQFDTAKIFGTSGNDIYIKYNDTLDWKYKYFDLFGNVYNIADSVMPSAITPMLPAGVEFQIPIKYEIPLTLNDFEGKIENAEINSTKLKLTLFSENLLGLQAKDIQLKVIFSSKFYTDLAGDTTIVLKSRSNFGVAEVDTLLPFIIKSTSSIDTLRMTIMMTVKPTTNVVVVPTSKLKIAYTIFETDAKVYYGRFFTPDIDLGIVEQAYDLTEYINEIPDKSILKITDPEITLNVLNHSGIGGNLVFDTIKAYKANDAGFEPIYALFNGNKSRTVAIARKNSINDSAAETLLKLDNTAENGDIDRFFQQFPLPDKLFYKFDLEPNYKTGDPLEFFSPTDKVEGQLSVKVPLKLDAGSSYIYTDTLTNVSFEGLNDDGLFNDIFFVFKVINKFPLKGKLSIQFLDEHGNELTGFENLLNDSIIAAPEIDEQGDVLTGKYSESFIILSIDKDEMDRLGFVKNIKYSIEIESEENRKITFRRENELVLKLGVFLKNEKLFDFGN